MPVESSDLLINTSYWVVGLLSALIGGLVSGWWTRRQTGKAYQAQQQVALDNLQRDLAHQQLLAQQADQQQIKSLEQEKTYLSEQFGHTQLKFDEIQQSLQQHIETATKYKTLAEETEKMKEQLSTEFQNLSQKILKQSMVEMEAKHEKNTTRQHEKLSELVKPLTELLDTSQKKVESLEKESIATKASLDEQLKNVVVQTEKLHNTNNQLTSALSQSKGRGDWGELQLKRILELSGLQEGVHYKAQLSYNQSEMGGTASRPDVLIHLPNNRTLYVDAKTILVNLERTQVAYDDSDESTPRVDLIAKERERHAKAIESEVKKLSLKSYEKLTSESLDFVVLFLPRESMLRVALEEKPDLIEVAFHQRVILASPLILMALLKTVAQGWQEDSMSKNALEIRDLAIEFHDRSAVFLKHFLAIETQLDKTTLAFDKAKSSFTSRLSPQLQKIEGLGAKSKKQIPDDFLIESSDTESLPLETNAESRLESVAEPV